MVGLLPKELLDKLGIRYREMSNRLLICCPFHGDRNPSSNFYHSTGLFHCFACGLTLDVVGFYAKFREMPRARAEFELIATYGGVPEERIADSLVLVRTRRRAEELLAAKRSLDRNQHAALAEFMDKILYCYQRKLLTDEQFNRAVTGWYIRIEQAGEVGQDIE